MNTLYTGHDITWIKNVTSLDTKGAYMNIIDEDFTLNFPTNHKGNVLSPQVGEIIVLYQNIDGEKLFTHFVSPIDDLIIENNEEKHRYGRRVQLIALAKIPIHSTLWKTVNFQGVSRGNACKISNISNIGNYDILLLELWEKFTSFFKNSHFLSVISTKINEMETSDLIEFGMEGQSKLIKHYVSERDPNIVKLKKQQALNNDHLRCEVCEFSFIEKFGQEFIECHHKRPIALSGITKTTLNDLSLVCANCHRMLHKQFDGHFLTVSELKEKFKA